MQTFQVVVTEVPYVNLWEVEVVGVGMTQSESADDAEVEKMARDYLGVMGEFEGSPIVITHATTSMRFARMQAYAAAIRTDYDRYNDVKRARRWDVGDFMLGAMTDFGQLARHVMAFEEHRDDPEGGIDLGHHLADMLWSVMAVAAMTGTDLEAAFKELIVRLQASVPEEIVRALHESDSAKRTL